ncbi:tRNA (adenosine(37)-N6)-dimethylallyltransferase MiaA [Gemmiger sp.]|uniref:tRNA (adenosine(37)-N6)-dimethylallyltransferase MiaA n=1 Tax=Gemmiger sp. TaxID=2049027 RepID=UPI002A755A14|nr:tRNA (adenosine(37)-N6)-dimethylallyltransferase MiaA [Gemmiger sp.]MDY6007238.1 tRNA (adenosine(37)-N6)-dimethylallyltransferase MiaA [Gemmiger sp.]
MADLCNLPRMVAIGGPTATGKTALSVALAKEFGGEVVNADSMQIYRGLDIGTAKPTAEERQGIPHHLMDFLPPEAPYSVADFTAAAAPLIEQLNSAGKLPIVTGGTGLYITSLMKGTAFAPEKTDPAIRARLQTEADEQGSAALYARLQQIDPAYAEKLHPNNLPRVIRALELFEATGRRMSEQQRAALAAEPPYRSLCICLTCRDRAELYRRIDRRVDSMLQNGVLEEAKLVYDNRETYRTAAQAIGYKEFFPYFAGEMPLNDCANRLKQATRNYAKRQLTWFRHQANGVWLYVDEEPPAPRAAELVRQFLQN